MMQATQALNYLSRDRILYADLIDPVRRASADVLVADERGVLLYDRGSESFMMTSANPEAVDSFCDIIGHPEGHIVTHEDFSVPMIRDRFGFRHHNECKQSAYLGESMPAIERPDLRVETLDPSWTDAVTAQYTLGLPAEHMHERLEAGAILGAFRGDDLVGFIGQHPEGSMGMLEVYPKYRHEGIGMFLMTYLGNLIISEGRTPFDQIIVGNEASESLQTKLGFTIADGRLWWMSAGRQEGPCCGDVP